MVIEGSMLGNRPLRRPRSGTLILEDGMYENIKRELSYKEDDTRNAIAYDKPLEREYGIECNLFWTTTCTLSAIISRSVAYQMKYIAECKMTAFYVSEPKRQPKHKISKWEHISKDHSTLTFEESNHPLQWNSDYPDLLLCSHKS